MPTPPASGTLALLDRILRPATVAVVGSAGPNGFARKMTDNFAVAGTSGVTVWAVTRQGDSALGHGTYPTLSDLPEAPDCAILSVRAEQAVDLVEEALGLGVRAFVVHSAGFAEEGPAGAALQDRLARLCAAHGAALLGPNCMGVHNQVDRVPLTPLLVPGDLRTGGVAVASQSGTVPNSLLSVPRGLGLAYVVTTGNECVITLEDVVNYYVDDPRVEVVVAYLEQLRRPQQFLAAARRARAAGKPVVVVKTGNTTRGAAVARSHTGALAGAAEVYRAAFDSAGVLQAGDLDELVELVLALGSDVRSTAGASTALIGNSGGLLSLAVDLAEQVDLPLAELAPATVERLEELLQTGEGVRVGNPLDSAVGFRSRLGVRERYEECIRLLAADDAVDVVAAAVELTEFIPEGQDWVYCRELVDVLAGLRPHLDKPLVAFSHASSGVHPELLAIARASGLPLLQGTRTALQALAKAGRWTPAAAGAGERAGDPAAAGDPRRVARILREGPAGEAVDESSVKALLRAYGVPVVADALARSAGEARRAVAGMAAPAVLKVASPDIVHKAALGGVAMNVTSPEQAARAYGCILESVAAARPDARLLGVTVSEQRPAGLEVFFGVKDDPQFGPVVLVGLGGVLVNDIGRVDVLLPPVSAADAEAAVARLPSHRRAPAPAQGRSADEELASILRRLGELAVDARGLLSELDVNPVIVSGPRSHDVAAVDASATR